MLVKQRSAVTALVLVLLTIGCRPEHAGKDLSPGQSAHRHDPSAGWFADRASASGLDFHYASGHRDKHLFPEIMGGGAALLDFDNDGDLDVYLVQGGSLAEPGNPAGKNRLFRNDGDARFTDVTDPSGTGDMGYGMGCAAGDYDNDGDTDLYVTNVGRNTLYRNNGDGTFSDVTAESGTGDTGWGTSAAFVDYDRDGDLDLYVCNYVYWTFDSDIRCSLDRGVPDYCGPQSYEQPQPDTLYRNNGDGTFSDVSEPAGILKAKGNGLGVVCFDVNQDGWIDIFVANDMMYNLLWINNGDGTFSEQGLQYGCAQDRDGMVKAGMGTHAADLDADDDLDLIVVNLARQTDTLFRNERTHFTDDTAVAGLALTSRQYTRFGAGFVDFDNDGDFDLFLANGRVALPDVVPAGQADPYAEPNLLLEGISSGRFQRVDSTAAGDVEQVGTSRAAAFGDLNNDGRVDIIVVDRDGPTRLLLNEKEAAGHWLTLRVVESSGRDAVNAIVRCRVGDQWRRFDVNPHYSYCASNDPRVHIGLTSANTVERIEVQWVDGSREEFGPFAANTMVTIRRGEGTATPTSTADSP